MGDSIRNNRFLAAAIFVFFFSLYAYCMQGVRLGADELGMYLVTESLVADGDVYIDPAWGARVALDECEEEGRSCARFGIGQSLAQLPLYLFGKIFIKENSSPDVFGTGRNLYLVTSLTGPLLGAAACVLLFLFCLRLGWRARAAVYLTALFGLGTLAWPYAGLLFSESLQMFALIACAYFILTYSQCGGVARAAAAGFFLGLAVAAKFMIILVLPVALGYAYLLLRGSEVKKRDVFYNNFALFIVWIAVIFWYNLARFRNPFAFGYYLLNDRDALFRFGVPLWSGLHGLLLSSGKGLFWYVPCAAAACAAFGAFARRRPAEAFLCAGAAVALVLGYARWNQWHGDYAWGPRFLVPLMPFIVLPLGAWLDAPSKRPALRAAALAALFAVSVFVQLLGVSVKTGAYLSIAKSQPPFQVLFMPGDIRLRDDLLNQHFIPEFSPLAAHAWILRHTLLDAGKPVNEINKSMREDFPWKPLIRNGAPVDPALCAGWNFWHAYFKEYVPGSRRWAATAAAASLLMCLAAACVILWSVSRNDKKE